MLSKYYNNKKRHTLPKQINEHGNKLSVEDKYFRNIFSMPAISISFNQLANNKVIPQIHHLSERK